MASINNTPRPAYIYDTATNEWIPIGVGAHSHNEIPKTVVDAKGDLIVGTAADEVNRLAVGSNGYTLVADSSTSTGLAYSPTFFAGKNKIINGDFNINQRAFSSSTAGASNAYCFDRWMQIGSGGTTTWTAQTFTAGTAPVAGYEGKNFLQIASTNQSAAGDNSRITQKIESVRTFANQTVTISFWARATSGTPSIAAYFYQDFGTGGSPSAGAAVNGDKVTLSTSWARYSISINIPSISGKTIGTNNDDSLWAILVTSGGTNFNSVTNSIGIQSTTIQIWGVQVEAGSTVTQFQTATGTIQGELAACQRYYWRQTDSETYSYFGMGIGETSTVAQIIIHHPVIMRVKPTSLDYSSLRIWDCATFNNVTNLAISWNSTKITNVGATVASGSTASRPQFLMANGTTAYIGFSAEL